MPLQATVEAAEFDALPDVTVLGKDSFVKNEKENKFFLNLPADEAGKLAFNLQASVTKLTSNNAELLKQKGEADAAAEAYKTLGKTPEEIKELLNSKRPEDIQKLVETHRTEMEAVKTSYAEAEKQRTEALSALQKQLAETNTRAEISRLRAEFDLNDVSDFVLRDYIRSEPKEEGSNEFVTRVYDNGSPFLVAGEPGKPDQLIKSFIEGKKFPAMFNAGTGGGTGAQARQSAGSGGSIIRLNREEVKSNPSIYANAKEQAAKSGATIQFAD